MRLILEAVLGPFRKVWPLSSYVAILAFALIVPGLALTSLIVFQRAKSEQAQLEQETAQLSDIVLSKLDAFILSTSTLLNVVASSPALSADDLGPAKSQIRQISQQVEMTLVLWDEAGHPIADSRGASSSPTGIGSLPVPGPPAGQLNTGRPLVSTLFSDAAGSAWQFAITVPVQDSRGRARSLSAYVPSKHIGDLLTRTGFAAPFKAAVTDPSGRIIARTGDDNYSAGRMLPAFEEIQGQHGSWTGTNVQGVPVYATYDRSQTTGWLIGVSVSAGALQEPLGTSAQTIIQIGGCSLVTAFVISWIVIRRILAAQRILASQARALGRGDIVTPLKTRILEVNVISAIISAASRRLHDQSSALAASNRDLEDRVADRTAAMAKHEALLAVIIDSLDQGLVMVHGDAKVGVVNRRAYQLLGFGRATPLAEIRLDILGIDLNDVCGSRPESLMLANETREVEGADGAILEMRATRLASGGVVCSYLDVTPRKKAEAALRENTAILDVTLESMDQGLVMVDAAGHIRVCNQRALNLLGLADKPHGSAGLEARRDSGLDRISFARLNASGLQTAGRLSSFEQTRSDGVVLEIRTVSLAGGGAVRTLTDITERKRAEAALAESEARYRLLAEASDDVITRMDLHFVRDYVSPACRRLLGYEPSELVGEKPASIIHPDDCAEVYEITRRLLRCEVERDTAVYRARHKDGHWIWVEAGLSLLRNEATGEPEALLANLRDVTGRQQVAIALAEANRQAEVARRAAEAASVAKTDFLAAMSHEIRTPLNGVIGYTDLLLRDEGLTADQRHQVERIHSCGGALITIVDDILDFSKIEAGRADLDPRPFRLRDLIEATFAVVQGAADHKGLKLKCRIDPALADPMLGDSDRLRQILLNLLNNAIKFTPAGSVELAVERLPGSTAASSRLRFEVTDTGIGIARAKVDRLFEKFSQVDSSIRRDYGGTGLGLAICRRLVDLMGGEIGLDSQEGLGSTFWFSVELPIAEAQQLQPTAGAAAAPRNARILVVDDVSFNRELASAILGRAGYLVETAGDGAEAIRAAASSGYDLILMDIQMPGVDGITATQHIRGLGTPASAVPIVAMTANVMPSQVELLRSAGLTEHVAKPFRAPHLLALVDRILSAETDDRASGPVDPPAAAFDATTFETFQALVGSEAAIGLMRRLAADLGAAIEEASPKAMADAARTLAAPADLLGFPALARVCVALERATVSGDDVSFTDIRLAHEAVLDELARRAA